MANEIQSQNLKESALVSDDDYDDLGAGVRLSFPVLSYRGQMWWMRYQREELALVDDKGEPVKEIGVSLIKVPENLSKRYFEGQYRQGDNNPPSCWSDDGKRPHPSAKVPQQPDGRATPSLCSNCYMDIIGSANTNDKTIRMKACGDYKRIAVRVVYPEYGRVIVQNKWGNDLIPLHETTALAMLLTVPAGSLKNLSSYGDELRREKVRAIARTTWIGFVPGLSFPKLTFRPGPEFDDETFLQMRALRNDTNTARILERDATVEDAATEPVENGATVPVSTPPVPPTPTQPTKPVQVQAATAPPIKPIQAQAPVQPTQPAPTPLRPTLVPGGRPIKPVNPINLAISKPSAPPASARQVGTTPEQNGGTQEENTPAPEAIEDEVDAMFNALKTDGRTSN